MERVWYRHDQEVVKAGLRRGERPDLATPLGTGVLDELLALHEELGILGAVGELAMRASVPGWQRAAAADAGGTAVLAGGLTEWGDRGAVSGAGLLLRLSWSPVEYRRGRMTTSAP